MTFVFLTWLAGALVFYSRMRDRHTRACGRLARAAEVVTAMLWFVFVGVQLFQGVYQWH